MRLMTKTLEKAFSKFPIGSQDNDPDPWIIAKFFSIISNHRWFATEYDPKNQLFFGWVTSTSEPEGEFGYWSLADLDIKMGQLPYVERDLFFKKQRLSSVKRNFPA